MDKSNEPHLKVYSDRSVLITPDGTEETFREGRPNAKARERHADIERRLAGGYLDELIDGLRRHEIGNEPLDPEHLTLLESLVDSVTSEVGRALVGLGVLVLCIKDISPNQSVRLHKGGSGDFSWEDGLPMRSLDSKYVTPALRAHELLRVNNFGIFMTRSLAENYPYSGVYKAAMRGAKEECFRLIDWIESGYAKPRPLLEALLSILINRSDGFKELGDATLSDVGTLLSKNPEGSDIRNLIKTHIANSAYGARLLEVAMHSLMQVLDMHNVLPGRLERLSQMRSANKKHGNVADIEVVGGALRTPHVIEAWDAKYGKPYLRDELEELDDKLRAHAETIEAGFVIDRDPEIDEDISRRIEELELLHDVKISILTLDDWLKIQIDRSALGESAVMNAWMVAYAESLALRRPEIAPIDEPADRWLQDLRTLL